LKIGAGGGVGNGHSLRAAVGVTVASSMSEKTEDCYRGGLLGWPLWRKNRPGEGGSNYIPRSSWRRGKNFIDYSKR